MAIMGDLSRWPFRKSLGSSQDFIREQILISCHKVHRSDISGEGRGMIEQIVLVAFCIASVTFMIYVLFGLQRAIRREQRDRPGIADRASQRQNKSSNVAIIDGVQHESSAFDDYETHAIGPNQYEFTGIGFDLQPLRKSSARRSR